MMPQSKDRPPLGQRHAETTFDVAVAAGAPTVTTERPAAPAIPLSAIA